MLTSSSLYRTAFLALLALASLLHTGCGYNTMVDKREAVNGAWSQVENQYQRRADLIPNLVRTVQGAANFEKETLTQITEARARVGQTNVSSDVFSDPAKLKQYEQAQAQLGGALSRLLVVSENYPQLRANENFQALQVQLEGTENRISVERRRFVQVVQDYNTTIKRFPNNIFAGWFGFAPVDYYNAVTPGSDRAPEVKF